MVKYVNNCKTPCQCVTLIYARSFMMKYFIYIINLLLIVSIPMLIITDVNKETAKINTEIDIKKVNSLKLNVVQENTKIISETEMEVKDEQLEEVETTEKEEQTKETSIEKTEIIEEKVEESQTDVIQTMNGTMSGYGTDCSGCGGLTASGYNLKKGIYYDDATYGKVRILAGDRSLKYGSIIRIKNSKLGEFIGIVLDRGGAVGIGKSHLFDLLFQTEKEALSYEVSYNVTFEILRYGY